MKTLNTIPSGRYQGYIWMSDKTQPRVIDGPFEGMDLELSNPFIIESRLYDVDNHISYAVNFHDGTYDIFSYCINELPKLELKSYIPSFDNAPGGLLFATIWREEEDMLCEGMHVLTPCESVFVGFMK